MVQMIRSSVLRAHNRMAPPANASSAFTSRHWRGFSAAVSSGGLQYVGEWMTGTTRPPENKFDHLVCFLPGLLALGHLHGIETGMSRRQPLDQSGTVNF
jgi:hypothetical protein